MGKILIVDDAAYMRLTMKDNLIKNGYTDLIEAEDGAKAVSLYQKYHPDLVIMDITMPKMDGLNAMKAIMLHDPNAVIVVCAVKVSDSQVLECFKLGVKDYIEKPFKAERILKAVRDFL